MNATTTMPHSLKTNKIIRAWLNERNQLLSLYCELSDSVQNEAGEALIHLRLDQFCELLVDYISAGHFEVYAELLDLDKLCDRQSDTLSGLYSLLTANTGAVLAYNDLLTRQAADEIDQSEIREPLSELGELMVSRFDWEDQLLTLQAYKALAA